MSGALVHGDDAPMFTMEQQRMIRDSYAMGATREEFAMLLAIAQARRLNPLLKQIHFVKRWDSQRRCEVWSAQASIDGLRAIAERTGRYDGQDEPEFVEGEGGAIVCCKVRVYRKDWSRPVVGVAYWSEYVQSKKDGALTPFWARMPHVMLSKCAEAIALRKAFPEDMSGLYVPEEMGSKGATVDQDAPAELAHAHAPQLPAAPPHDWGRVAAELSLAIASATTKGALNEAKAACADAKRDGMPAAVSYTHLTLPTNREV